MHHTFIFSAAVVFSWLVISNSLPKFSRDVAMATRMMNLFYKFSKKLLSYALHIQCIFNIFKSAGVLAIVDFSYVTEIYKAGCHGNSGGCRLFQLGATGVAAIVGGGPAAAHFMVDTIHYYPVCSERYKFAFTQRIS